MWLKINLMGLLYVEWFFICRFFILSIFHNYLCEHINNSDNYCTIIMIPKGNYYDIDNMLHNINNENSGNDNI